VRLVAKASARDIAPVTRVSLLRHVRVDGPPALYGHTDIAPRTEDNARLLAWLLQQASEPLFRFDLIISSPLKRCRILAQQLSQQTGIPCLVRDELKEMNFGEYDGVPFDALGDHWQALEPFWHSPAEFIFNGGETLAEFHHRVVTGWQGAIKEHRGKNILVVTHGGVIRQLLANALNLDWKNPALYSGLQIANASMSRLSYFGEQGQSARVDCIASPLPSEN